MAKVYKIQGYFVDINDEFELYSISPSGGVKMEYWLNVPEGAHSNGRLVMFLHGDSEIK